MKLLESDRDRKVIEFSADEFIMLLGMSMACYEDYEDIEPVHLKATREEVLKVHDDLYGLLDKQFKMNEGGK